MPRTSNKVNRQYTKVQFENNRVSSKPTSYLFMDVKRDINLKHWLQIRQMLLHLPETEPKNIQRPRHGASVLTFQSRTGISGRSSMVPQVQSGMLHDFYSPKPSTRAQSAFIAAKLSSAVSLITKTNLEILQEFENYARQIIEKENIKLSSTDIREWESLENTAWKQLIIYFIVESNAKTALALWDNLSEELSAQAPQLRELLSVTVQWQRYNDV